MDPRAFLERLNIALDRLRERALSGEQAAADQMRQMADQIGSMSVPERIKVEVLVKAVSAQGHVLLLQMTSAFVTARAAAAAGVSSAEAKVKARRSLDRLAQWRAGAQALADRAAASGFDRAAAEMLNGLGSVEVGELLNYPKVAPADGTFHLRVDARVDAGLERSARARAIYDHLGEREAAHRMRLTDCEWLWAASRRDEAREVASALAADLTTSEYPDVRQQAERIAAGESPVPELDALPAVDLL